MLEAISILLALLIGFLLVHALDPVPNMQPLWAAVLFHTALGTGIGIGLASVIFLLLTVTGAASPFAIFSLDIILAAGLGWHWFRMRSGNGASERSDVKIGRAH